MVKLFGCHIPWTCCHDGLRILVRQGLLKNLLSLIKLTALEKLGILFGTHKKSTKAFAIVCILLFSHTNTSVKSKESSAPNISVMKTDVVSFISTSHVLVLQLYNKIGLRLYWDNDKYSCIWAILLFLLAKKELWKQIIRSNGCSITTDLVATHFFSQN